MKVGILYICTGKYTVFWKDFYLSMERNFIEDSEKHYFVFTDSPHIEFENENPRIHRIYQEHLGWPDITLMRFHIFLKAEKEISEMDYLFFFNANLLVLKKITEEDFLPEKENLLATLHPGFYNKDRKKFTYDKNKKSTAFISKNEGSYYFAGGLNGGKATDFIKAMKIMRDNIDKDKQINVIAKWHDESHWNKYLSDKKDVKVLPPSYLYPEGWVLPFEPIILVRDKNKYGGHEQIRNQKVPKLEKFVKIIKTLVHKVLKQVMNKGYRFFIYKKSIFSNLDKFNINKSNFIIITIAFNNIEVIKIQHQYIKNNFKESCQYIVADNSSLSNISKEIREYCISNNIPYIKLPINPFQNNPSRSHGFAINWSYYNVIKKCKPKFFGFIDHDIIPFKETTITENIDKVWGLTQKRASKWYLWPGFCFYNYDFVKNLRLNFMPTLGLDTGGSNYNILYKKIDINNLNKIKQIYINLKDTNIIKEYNHSNNTVEIIGDWVHIMRVSNWNNNENKKYKLDEIIDIIKNKNFN